MASATRSRSPAEPLSLVLRDVTPNQVSSTCSAKLRGRGCQQTEFSASDGAANHEFGYPVAISKNIIVVAAPEIDVGLGLAYVYKKLGDSWTQQAELSETPDSGGGEFPGFGWSVGVSGHTVVVGMPGSGPNGAAYVFSSRRGVWTKQAELVASDGFLGDSFGDAVAASGQDILVGAPSHTIVAGGAGAAYIFRRVHGTWTQRMNSVAPPETRSVGGGSSIRITLPSWAQVSGASGNGVAYVFP